MEVPAHRRGVRGEQRFRVEACRVPESIARIANFSDQNDTQSLPKISVTHP